jgi:hypothetical protein
MGSGTLENWISGQPRHRQPRWIVLSPTPITPTLQGPEALRPSEQTLSANELPYRALTMATDVFTLVYDVQRAKTVAQEAGLHV